MSQQQNHLLAQGQTQGSAPRAHQQALTNGPFGYTCEADAVSAEVAMGGLQDRDVYKQGKSHVDPTLEHYNMHISLIKLYLLHTSIISTTRMQYQYIKGKEHSINHTQHKVYVVHPLSRATSTELCFIMY
jgi:hypothetical protein